MEVHRVLLVQHPAERMYDLIEGAEHYPEFLPWCSKATVLERNESVVAATIGIDWHGHRDRDLAIINSIAALEAGASRVHAAALGIGERVGNAGPDLFRSPMKRCCHAQFPRCKNYGAHPARGPESQGYRNHTC